MLSGFILSDGGSNTVAVAAGECLLADSDSETDREIGFYTYAGGTTDAIADGTTRWVFAYYNSGAVGIKLSATEDIDEQNAIILGWVTREGAVLHITNAQVRAGNLPHDFAHTLREVLGFARASFPGGLILGEIGTRNPTLSAGSIYYGRDEFEIDAIDCSGADTFTRYYPVAGTWTKQTGLTQWPNAQYSDGTNLQNLTVNRWGTLWFYVDLEDGELIMLYGTSNAAQEATAEAEAPPATAPERVAKGCVLVGRYIFQQGASSATVQSAFNAAFNPAGVSDHEQLANIGTNTHAQIDSHIGSTSNPHSVTAAQVGAYTDDEVDGLLDDRAPSLVLNSNTLNATTYRLLRTVATRYEKLIIDIDYSGRYVSGRGWWGRIIFDTNEGGSPSHYVTFEKHMCDNGSEDYGDIIIRELVGGDFEVWAKVTASHGQMKLRAMRVYHWTAEADVITDWEGAATTTAPTDGTEVWNSSTATPQFLFHGQYNKIEMSGAYVIASSGNQYQWLTEKATPASDDLLLLEDSAASYAKRKVKVSNLGGGAVAPQTTAHTVFTDGYVYNTSGAWQLVTEQTSGGPWLVPWVEVAYASLQNVKVRYTVDGTVVWTSPQYTQVSSGDVFLGYGSVEDFIAPLCCRTSFKVEIATNTSGGTRLRVAYQAVSVT